MKERLATIFKTKTRDEWCEIMEGSDVCFAPVLTMGEAHAHPHNEARGTFVEVGGHAAARPGAALQPHPGRGRAAAAGGRRAHRRGARRLGFSREEIRKLRDAKAVA